MTTTSPSFNPKEKTWHLPLPPPLIPERSHSGTCLPPQEGVGRLLTVLVDGRTVHNRRVQTGTVYGAIKGHTSNAYIPNADTTAIFF